MNPFILHIAIFLTFVQIVQTYLFGDMEYLKWLFVLIVADTITGMLFHIKNKTFSSFGFSGVLLKILLYGLVLIVVNVLRNFQIDGAAVDAFGWFYQLALIALIVRESISVIENVGKIDTRLLPKWMLVSLKAIESNLEKKADAQSPDRR